MSAVVLFGLLALSYFLGSIPVGLLISRWKTGADLRKSGSGKTGATNVMRSAGKKWGLLTLLLDGLKAALAVLIATMVVQVVPLVFGAVTLDVSIVQGLSGIAAIAGHNRPALAGFKGGRGVSSFFGTMIVINIAAGLFGIEVLAIVALVSRRMSLGSLLGGVATSVVMLVLYITGWVPLAHLLYAIVATGWLGVSHRDNIGRLWRGTERQLF
ncbi:MAG: glycerol-3-phosphate acyltransferase [Dehalococcoidia bacterium]|nr:glycerol-3-phosphate acyltransferase [Dehalococcoidia bacterium]